MIWKQFTHLGNFPPELKTRFNSFLTTEFDDSLSVEMQLRSIIKWCQGNFKTVDTLIDFINDISNWLKQFEADFDTKLEDTTSSVLSEWQVSGKLDVVITEALKWQLDDFIKETRDSVSNLTLEVNSKADYDEMMETIGNVSNGSPLFAEALEDMTDVSRNYVYLNDGYVYTHNGETFVSTGQLYQNKGISNRSIAFSHLIIDGYLPLSVIYNYGRETGNDTRYVHADISSLKKGVVITTKHNASFGVWRLSGETFVNMHLGWVKDYEIPYDVSDVRIVARFDPLREITSTEIAYFSSLIEIITDETALKRKEVEELKKGNSLELEYGDIDFKGVNTTQTERRLRTKDYISVEEGTLIYNGDKENYQMAVAYSDGLNYATVNGWTNGDFRVGKRSNIRIMIKKTSNDVFESGEIVNVGKLFEVRGSESYIVQTDLKTQSQSVKYVTLNGSDSNGGNSMTDGYQTLQKALDSESQTIIIESGVYYNQSASLLDINKLSILSSGGGIANFVGGDKLQNWSTYNEIIRIPYSNNERYTKVFVDKTLPVETGGSRSSYNAVLWENDDYVSDYKMTPVLTLIECESTVGSFYYDGTYLYANPLNKNTVFHAVKTDNGLTLSGNEINLTGIVFDYYTNDPLNLDNVKKINAQNCGGHHSSTRDGWSLDYTSGEIKKCSGFKNRNDGFNLHFLGCTTFIDCNGSNNYDDGISHHENCEGTIIGGKWSGNAKGGVIPVDNAKVNVYNAIIENNHYGFYSDESNVSQGNLYIENDIAIRSVSGDVMSVNDEFHNNDVNTQGVVHLY